MARLTEIVVAIEAEGVNDVLNALKQVDGAQAKVADGAKKSGDAQKSGNDTAKMSWATLATGVNQVMGVINTAIQGGKAVYDFTKEGAQLEYAAGKFERLAEAAGTTSDVLMTDLRAATRGMVSDADLVAGAGDFMALGLAKSHDEVVRLTSVAGALGMNMNQLVLTLTNQTTMRFDQLGVSVDGFDEKVKKLEESGMSASDAFTEAFLQQAEEQIRKVGSMADTSAGSLKTMESAFKNLSDAIKSNFADSLDKIAPALANVADGMTQNEVNTSRLKTIMPELNSALAAGVITADQYKSALKDMGIHSNAGAVSAVGLEKTVTMLAESYALAGGTVDTTAESLIAQSIAAGLAENRVVDLTEAEIEAAEAALAAAEAQAQMKAELANITSVSGNYKGIVDLGYKYSDMLAEQEQLTIERQKLISQGYSKQSKEVKDIDDKLAGLDDTMANLANRVTLDMFEATIAVGGVTEAELSAYMQMAIDMGLMSEAGAAAAMDAYSNAIETINSYEIDEKTGNVVIDAADAYATLVMIQQMQIADKNANINIFTHYYGTTGNYDPYEDYQGPNNAIGGPVYPGQNYTWQEPGREGELLLPEQYGRVLSNHEVAMVLREAIGGGGNTSNQHQTVNNYYNNYSLTMPTSNSTSDVKRAFAIMEALNK